MGADTNPPRGGRRKRVMRWGLVAALAAAAVAGLWAVQRDAPPREPHAKDTTTASKPAATDGAGGHAGARGALRATPTAAADSAPAAGMALVQGHARGPAGTESGPVDVVVAGSGVWPPRQLRTDADGRFRVELPPGVYELRGTRGRLVAAPLEGVELDAGDVRELTLELQPGMSLRGTVLQAETGTPIADAAVQVAEDSLGLSAHALVTDAQGGFVLGGLRALPHRVSVHAAGFVSVLDQERRPGPEQPPFLLRRAATLSGQVLDSDGAPLADASLEVQGETELGEPLRMSEAALGFQAELFEQARRGPLPLGDSSSLGVTLGPVPKVPLLGYLPSTTAAANPGFRSGPDGSFRITGLPAATVRVVARKAGYAPSESGEVRVHAGQTRDGLLLSLGRGGRVEGRVTDARGFPVPLVRVELSGARGQLPQSVLAADDGSFSFEAVLGRVVVTAQAPGLPAVSARTLVSAGQTQTLAMALPSEAQTLSGRVFDTGRRPLEHALVRVRTAGPRPVELAEPTEPDGTFSLPGLPPPPWELTVEHSGYAPHSAKVRSAEDPLEVTLAEGYVVRGRILDAFSGEPLAGAQVQLSGPGLAKPITRTTRNLGSFEFSDIIAGNYSAIASHAEYASATQTFRVETGLRDALDLDDVRLQPAGRIRGEVVDRLGAPVYGAEVTLGAQPDWSAAVRTDHEGRFVLEGVVAGDTWLHARVEGDQVQSDSALTVRAGDEAVGALLRLSVVAPEPPETPDPDDAPATEGAASDADATPAAPSSSPRRTEQGVALSLGWREQAAVVTAVGAGSRAAAAGVRTGDKLESVDGEPVLAAAQGRAMLRGPAGSRVRLELLRGKQRLFKNLERERYPALAP